MHAGFGLALAMAAAFAASMSSTTPPTRARVYAVVKEN
jgi:hypothetical protein